MGCELCRDTGSVRTLRWESLPWESLPWEMLPPEVLPPEVLPWEVQERTEKVSSARE